jgi:cell division FtsZ-interacting protein ZapD
LKTKQKKKETLEDRVNKLTAALKESSQLVTEVEEEIQSRQQLVSELQKDAEKYQKLISINQEQVEAVAQLLQGELRKEGNKSFWKGVIANFIFFIMGAGLSWYLSKGF